MMSKNYEASNPKYPEVVVRLSGQDGNAFYILGAVAREMNRAGLSGEAIQAFNEEATSGDYDHLLRTAMRTVTVR